MSDRKQYKAEDKVRILREHFESKVSISDLSEKYGVHPSQLNRWKKSLFEGALDTFSGTHKKRKESSILTKLKQKISKKDEVISILTEELLQLKKNFNGEI